MARNTGVLLEEQAGSAPSLRITVPKDSDKQHLSFLSYLPRELYTWLMATSKDPELYEDPKAIHALSLVLNAPVSIVHWILDSEGIVSVDVPTAEDVQSLHEPPSPAAGAPINATTFVFRGGS